VRRYDHAMVRLALACAIAATACGRIGFDARAGLAGDAARGDGAPSGDALGAPLAFVQVTGTSSPNASIASAPYPNAVASGDLLVVAADFDAPVPAASALFDALGNSYQLAQTIDDGGFAMLIGYTITTATGDDTVTLDLGSATPTNIDLHLIEYAGTSLSAPLDVGAGSDGIAQGIDAAATVLVASGPGELLFGFCTFKTQGSQGTGFTARQIFDGDPIEDRITAAAGEQAVTATPGSDSSSWAILGAAFRPR
jgi:hypothetical protein